MEKPSTPHGPYMKKGLFLITYAIVLFLLLSRVDAVWAAVKWGWKLLSPLLLAIMLAFIFHLPMDFFQYKLFKRWENSRFAIIRKLWRGVSMLCAYLSVFLVISGLVALVLPRIAASVSTLAINFGTYLQRFQVWADGFLSSLVINPAISEAISEVWGEVTGFMQRIFSSIVSGAFDVTIGITSGVANLVIALMLSGFMLYTRKTLFGQIHRLSTQIIGKRKTARLREVFALVDTIFSKYIYGQVTEAFILGLLCFIGMSVLKLSYALLISTVVGFTALVPILGAWIGTLPCALILLVIEPRQALVFLLFILVLQQLEGDLIYPRVVGNAIGLPGLFVLASILLGGGIAGLWGMLLGTPTAAVCYHLVGEWLKGKERSRSDPPSASD